MKMTTGKQYNDKFKSHLGDGGAKAHKYCHMSGGPWCCAEVSLVYGETNKKLFYGGKYCTYCPNAIKWARAFLAELPLYMAMGGDLIFFDWNNNGVPDHIGEVDFRIDTEKIATVEGNTGDPARVRKKTRPAKYVLGVFRPLYAPKTTLKKQALNIDGAFENKSIYMLQVALGMKNPTGIFTKDTVKALQKKAKTTPDGSWKTKTSKAVQKMVGAKQDGAFGKQSVMKLQEWINKQTVSKPASEKKPVSASKPSAPTNTTTPDKKTDTDKNKPVLKSRRIEIDITNQIATVYGVYSDKSVKPIMSEYVSTARKGYNTPIGNFKIQGAKGGLKAKLRTAKMASGKTYAEFCVRFIGHKCMHMVPWKKRNTKGYVFKSEFNKLGTPASAGCVRMPAVLAKYIYEKCPLGTPVIVFKGKKGEYPMGKPKKYTATTDIDPTYKK